MTQESFTDNRDPFLLTIFHLKFRNTVTGEEFSLIQFETHAISSFRQAVIWSSDLGAEQTLHVRIPKTV